MGFANVRAGTQKIVVLLSTRPNISESHSETSTRVPFCIAKTGRGRVVKVERDPVDGLWHPRVADAVIEAGAGALDWACAKMERECAVLNADSVAFHAPREVDTPHPSTQTPAASSSKYWETGRNRTVGMVRQPLAGHSYGPNSIFSPLLGPHPRRGRSSSGLLKPKARSDELSNSPRVLFVESTVVRRPRAERTSGCRFISHFSLYEDSFEYCPWHLSLRRCVKLYRSQSCFQSLCEYVPNGSLQDGNAMRGVERGFGMLFTPHGRLARHIRVPKHQRQARASTGNLG